MPLEGALFQRRPRVQGADSMDGYFFAGLLRLRRFRKADFQHTLLVGRLDFVLFHLRRQGDAPVEGPVGAFLAVILLSFLLLFGLFLPADD